MFSQHANATELKKVFLTCEDKTKKMKKLLFVAITMLCSCSNMESDVEKVCSITTKTMEMMPEVLKLSMKASLGDESSKEESQKELDKLQTELERMGNELETIKNKYDEDEFEAAIIENCEAAKKLKEMGDAFDGIGKALEN